MQRSTFLFIAALIVNGGCVQAQGLLQTITAPEKAVPVVNQTLEGTWLLELRTCGPTCRPATGFETDRLSPRRHRR